MDVELHVILTVSLSPHLSKFRAPPPPLQRRTALGCSYLFYMRVGGEAESKHVTGCQILPLAVFVLSEPYLSARATYGRVHTTRHRWRDTFFMCTVRSSLTLGERFAPSSRLGTTCNCNVICNEWQRGNVHSRIDLLQMQGEEFSDVLLWSCIGWVSVRTKGETECFFYFYVWRQSRKKVFCTDEIGRLRCAHSCLKRDICRPTSSFLCQFVE